MKTKSKILLAAITLFIISSSSAFAKKKSHSSSSGSGRFSIGVEGALPMGNFGDFANFGFGGSVRYEMPVTDNIALTGTVGYLSFSAKNSGTDGIDETVSMIPIMIGGKYYFTQMQNGFYFTVAIGVTSTTVKVTVPAMNYGYGFSTPAESVSASNTNFSLYPGVGYHLANIDFGLSYNIVTATGGSLDYLGLRVAYVFGGG